MRSGKQTMFWPTAAAVDIRSRITFLLIAFCNNYRWDYSPEEFQWVLKLGVWARTQIERGTSLGAEVRDMFHEYELNRQGRRKLRLFRRRTMASRGR